MEKEDCLVSLEEMLWARENRVKRQESFRENGRTLIALTMNIAGPCKNISIIEKAFQEGIFRVKENFSMYEIEIALCGQYSEKTGPEAYFSALCTPQKAKALTVQIEDSLSIGRLFDLDVMKTEGDKVSRTELGLPARQCIICNLPANQCAPRRNHSVSQLQFKTIEIICDYFNSQFADAVSKYAHRALMYEVSTTPKPGLVDRHDNGAHNDMDFFTFIDSAGSLCVYFHRCALMGIELCEQTPIYLFEQLRYLGRIAEKEMFAATGGVNTHKGLIFSMGIISAALGYLYANGKSLDTVSILNLCGEMTKNVLDDFKLPKETKTNGEKLFEQYRSTGVRGQAAAGYPAVKYISYPLLCDLLEKGYSYNDAGAIVLANLICAVEDTNIIKRSDFDTLQQVQSDISQLIEDDKLLFDSLDELNHQFIEKNISPGGCADLLAITFMLKFCEKLNDDF